MNDLDAQLANIFGYVQGKWPDTQGYLCSEQGMKESLIRNLLKALIAERETELLTKLTIEKIKPAHPHGKDEGSKLIALGFNQCVDELERRKEEQP